MAINLFVILFFIGGWAFNKIFSRFHLPGILGMVFFGILIRVFFSHAVPAVVWEVEPFLKSLALVVILLRAGLGIRRKTLQKVGKTAVLMAGVPCLAEAAGLTVMFRLLFGYEWQICALFSFVLSAVSPAVVVPSMLDLKNQGRGAKNGVTTMILASASADDVIAITFFSVFFTLVTGKDVNVAGAVLAVPFSILAGILFGLIAGFFLSGYFLRKYHKIRATEKTMLLLMAGLCVVEIGHVLHIAAFLGVMTLGFVLLERAEHVAHEVAQKLSKIWVAAEIVLFVLIGMAVDPGAAWETGVRGVVLIGAGLICRSLGVLFATAFDASLSVKERIFCVIAFLPKATVQAALGSVPLAAGVPGGGVIVSIAVMAIFLTAPLGVFLIHRYGPILLEMEEESER